MINEAIESIEKEGSELVVPEEKASEKRPDAFENRKAWDRFLDRWTYKGIVKNMPFLTFITFLAIIFIGNNNKAIRLVRAINQKKEELKEVRWRYMDVQSQLMYQTTESQLKQKTEGLGLKPLEEPAFEIELNKEVP